ncbi:MAG: hypothetical protein M0D55_17165 [Elusimicrobiota bacterium]|nr:MAG: hypothetical protein M0D55_17165 [Elusimicrobiota bacterium]
MRNPSSPLRRVLAVVLSVLILPWQQPVAALAQPAHAEHGVSAREPLNALDRRLEAQIERIKRDSADPAASADLPAKLAEAKAAYKAAQDAYVEALKTASDAEKPALRALTTPTTGQLIADALVETDLGGIRKDLDALLAQRRRSAERPPTSSPRSGPPSRRRCPTSAPRWPRCRRASRRRAPSRRTR